MSNIEYVIKLGGSAITKKDSPMTPNIEVIENIAFELSKLKHLPSMIIVYGGGSFGHFAAKKYLKNGKLKDCIGVSEVRCAMLSLAKIISEKFLKYGVPIFPISSSSIFFTTNDELKYFLNPLELSLKHNMIPILGGDVIIDELNDFKILSGDRIASMLAIRFNAKALIFGTDVDGIIINGRILSKVKFSEINSLLPKIGNSKYDVTGGMVGKLLE
ncbi:MAG: isopentenyl phosphate kinase, partial [Candidatus Methanomethyliaceae archaeon]|nr:isopentenyl phosphate kinase [Candidatus Methanomethyliaceae archaeon]